MEWNWQTHNISSEGKMSSSGADTPIQQYIFTFNVSDTTQTLTHSHQQPAHVSCVLYMYTQTHLVKLLQVGQSGVTGPEETGQTLLLSLWQTHTRHWRDCLVVQGQTWNTTRDNMRGLNHNIINTEQAGNAVNTLHTENHMCSIIYNRGSFKFESNNNHNGEDIKNILKNCICNKYIT